MSAGDFILIALLFVLCAIPGAITSIKIADKEWLSLGASVAGALVLSSVCLCFVSAFVPVWNSNGDDVASMAWSVRNLISTQVRALNKNGPLRLRDRALPRLRQRLGLPGATQLTGRAHSGRLRGRDVRVRRPSRRCAHAIDARLPRRMGFFQFSAMSLSWAPSLVFLAMGESTGDYQSAILVCPIFWLGGLAVLWFFVDVDTGLAEVEATLDKRFKSGGDVAPPPPPRRRRKALTTSNYSCPIVSFARLQA